jgi:hypothetical protein
MKMVASRHFRRALWAAAFCLAALAPAFVPSSAHAWWRGGGVFVGVSPFFFGPPVVFAPPPVIVAPPPVIFAPPPVSFAPPPASYAAPPPAFAGQPSRTCFAGGYTCPLGGNFPVGAGCSCPTGRGSAFGRAG